MKALSDQFRNLAPGDLTFEALGTLVQKVDPGQLDFKPLLPAKPPPGEYGWNILLTDPLEIVLIRWPAGIHSAIHHHEGFYEYVLVLSGTFEDLVYDWNHDVVREKKASYYLQGVTVAEPDGIIHQLGNAFQHYFTEQELHTLMERCGFSVVLIRYVGYVHQSGEWVDRPEEGFFFVDAVRK